MKQRDVRKWSICLLLFCMMGIADVAAQQPKYNANAMARLMGVQTHYFHATTEENSKSERDSTFCHVKLMKYDLSAPYVIEHIVFYDYSNAFSPKLRRYEFLSKKEKKQYITRHPEANIKGSKLGMDFWRKIGEFNKRQYRKLKAYNQTH